MLTKDSVMPEQRLLDRAQKKQTDRFFHTCEIAVNLEHLFCHLNYEMKRTAASC